MRSSRSSRPHSPIKSPCLRTSEVAISTPNYAAIIEFLPNFSTNRLVPRLSTHAATFPTHETRRPPSTRSSDLASDEFRRPDLVNLREGPETQSDPQIAWIGPDIHTLTSLPIQ